MILIVLLLSFLLPLFSSPSSFSFSFFFFNLQVPIPLNFATPKAEKSKFKLSKDKTRNSYCVAYILINFQKFLSIGVCPKISLARAMYRYFSALNGLLKKIEKFEGFVIYYKYKCIILCSLVEIYFFIHKIIIPLL